MHLNRGCLDCGGCGCASARSCGLLENLMEVNLYNFLWVQQIQVVGVEEVGAFVDGDVQEIC